MTERTCPTHGRCVGKQGISGCPPSKLTRCSGTQCRCAENCCAPLGKKPGVIRDQSFPNVRQFETLTTPPFRLFRILKYATGKLSVWEQDDAIRAVLVFKDHMLSTPSYGSSCSPARHVLSNVQTPSYDLVVVGMSGAIGVKILSKSEAWQFEDRTGLGMRMTRDTAPLLLTASSDENCADGTDPSKSRLS